MWIPNSKTWTFYIDSESIVIYKTDFDYPDNIDWSDEAYYLETTTTKWRIKKIKVSIRTDMNKVREQNCIFRFLTKYDEIREKLLQN